MKTQKIKAALAKVATLKQKRDEADKEIKSILMATCNECFVKGESINFTDKDNNKTTGKVLYHVGQSTLTAILPGDKKPNVPLDKLILTTE